MLSGLKVQISKRLVVGVFLLVLVALLVYCVISLWPAGDIVSEANGDTGETTEQEQDAGTDTVDTPDQEQDTGTDEVSDDQEDEVARTEASVFGIRFHINDEARLIFLVMLVGTLGSYVHVGTSFAVHIGRRTFKDEWIWWYVIRPFTGMALAVVFYFVVRGGLLFFGTGNGEVDIYGAVAIAGVVGMFSAPATEKLGELFKSKEDKGSNSSEDNSEENNE